MPLSCDQIIRYLALLVDPEQEEITRAAWTVATQPDDLVWAGWQPTSVVSVDHEPPPEWYRGERPTPTAPQRAAWSEIPASGFSPAITALAAVAGLRPASAVGVAGIQEEVAEPEPEYTPPPGVDGPGLERLAALDELHREESLARAGWLFIAGTIQRDGEEFRCCFPLFERRIRIVKVGFRYLPQWTGALQRHPLIRRRQPDHVRDAVDDFLAEGAGVANTEAGIGTRVAELLRHYDVELTKMTDATANPALIEGHHGTVLVPGAGFYLSRVRSEQRPSQSGLASWSRRHLGATALAELYRTSDAGLHESESRVSPIRTALPLNERQRTAIDRLDTETVVAVSGPPGTGKTHMIVAAASDAVARGMSVLVATNSDFAAESTCELLDRYPTPPHVRFGRNEHRRRVADLLSEGSAAGITDDDLAILDAADDQAWKRLEALGGDVLDALERKHAFEAALVKRDLVAQSGALAVLEPGFDLARLRRLETRVAESTGLARRVAVNSLRRLIGAPRNASLEQMHQSIEAALAERSIQDALDQAKGTALDDLWAELDRCEAAARRSQAILDIARRSRATPESIASVAELATALRSTDTTRLATITSENSSAFLHHLPFWVGTLSEIEQTLPALPGMFDLVIFDEASQIDQLAAAPALCRAQRALVVGDPRQLRHQTSTTPNQINAARDHVGLPLGPTTTMLDVAANSLFDVAAASTPVTWLDEHFRSVPHLIEFSSQRWYAGSLRLMTQHPRNEAVDVIDAVRVDGRRSSVVNEAEVTAILARLHDLASTGAIGSIGVISPFRQQAEALETAIVDAFDYDTIRELQLRVGTVRGVQGTERDTVLVSLAIDERDFEHGLEIVQDPHLFNVMITRARNRMAVFHSFDPEALPAGLLRDWYRYQDEPPGLNAGESRPVARWTKTLIAALELSDVRVVPNYPVAGWTIDLVIGEGDAAYGVETTVHPDGPRAHAERHLTLRRAGWDLVSMFESSWLLQTEEAAVYLAGLAARRAGR